MDETKLQSKTLTIDDVKVHNTKEDCWIALHSKVWNVTTFLQEHPGGASIILRYAGGDATEAYGEVHAPGIAQEFLAAELLVGELEEQFPPAPIPVKTEPVVQPAQSNLSSDSQSQETYAKPELSAIISAADFEAVASKTLTAKAWAFYSSAATDLVTHRANKALLRRVMLRPRVLRDVTKVCMKRTILGCPSEAPFFISPSAMARLVDKDGELSLARGAGSEGIIQCISSNASFPLGDIVAAGGPKQPFFLQLYVNSDRPKTELLLKKAKKLGVRAILVTVDAPVPGKREADERVAAANFASPISGAVAGNDKKGGGMGRLMAQYVDKSLNWRDIAWIKRVSGLPVVLKGVQSAADAKLAVEWQADGIMLSNHGGRSLDGSQPSILVLLELHKVFPEIFDKMEVYIDGGFERGSDILKAIALGATAVGLGRPFLYSLTYSKEGVEHLVQILKDEIEVSMRLLGANSLQDLHPGMINSQDVEHLIPSSTQHPWIAWKPKPLL